MSCSSEPKWGKKRTAGFFELAKRRGFGAEIAVRPGDHRRRFRSNSCFGAAAEKCVCRGPSSRVLAASELLQHFFLDLLDFVPNGTDAIQRAAESLGFVDDLIHLGKNVT